MDSRSTLIEALRTNDKDFLLSNIVLPKPASLKAIKEFFGLRYDLMQAAVNPSAYPKLSLAPREPDYEGMAETDALIAKERYQEEVMAWMGEKDAHDRKMSWRDYNQIEEYLVQYYETMMATAAVKGIRFKAFTKTGERPQQKGGILGSLMGGQRDE